MLSLAYTIVSLTFFSMVRLQRVSVPSITEHIIQRGNNRQVCFTSEDDMKAYLHWLREFSATLVN